MTSATDQQAADAIRAHHAEMAEELGRRVEDLLASVRRGEWHAEAQKQVLDYLENDLLPHATAEESTIYRAGDSGLTALLVRAMSEEHRILVARVAAFRAATDAVTVAASAAAIQALFEAHLWKEDELLVPTLVAGASVDIASLLTDIHELVG